MGCCSGNGTDLRSQYERFRRDEPVMRESCRECACKHIAQARVLLLEKDKGHPEHYWFAMGHLAEAEDELVKDFQDATALVRSERLNLQKNRDYEVPFADLITAICRDTWK
jgi:hypothetical protein